MLRRRTARRTCREHEKQWREFCVDKNLEDDWLERLNNLKAFALIGICEGHSDRRSGSSGRYPYISLRLKEPLLPGIAKHWEELRMAMLSEVSRLFEAADTDINLELKFRLRAGRGKLIYREDLTFRMRSYEVRASGELDVQARNWFERSVERIERLDGVVVQWHERNLVA